MKFKVGDRVYIWDYQSPRREKGTVVGISSGNEYEIKYDSKTGLVREIYLAVLDKAEDKSE